MRLRRLAVALFTAVLVAGCGGHTTTVVHHVTTGTPRHTTCHTTTYYTGKRGHRVKHTHTVCR